MINSSFYFKPSLDCKGKRGESEKLYDDGKLIIISSFSSSSSSCCLVDDG